ncbi:hypothetical protein PG984_008675 [Apiospora sp. TS-2023a]
MVYSQPTGSLLTLVTLLALVNVAIGASTPMTYCASINTGSGGGTNSIYQSDGLCRDQCNDQGTAFAIVQGPNCWCSDVEPARSVQVSTAKCNTQCPGYPDDTCGGNGLWGYMMLGKDPSGTQGADNPSPTATKTAQAGVGAIVASATSLIVLSKNRRAVAETIAQYVCFYCDTGWECQRRDCYCVPATSSTSTDWSEHQGDPQVEPGSKGLSTGAAVGVAVGVLGAIILTGAIGAFFWLRRKRQRQNQVLLDRQNSVRGSSAGMMSTPRTEMASTWDGDSTGRRNSRLMPHDPRMDPYAVNIYGRFDNKSHESINTLRDDRDYSRRVLRTTNPDPTDGEHL